MKAVTASVIKWNDTFHKEYMMRPRFRRKCNFIGTMTIIIWNESSNGNGLDRHHRQSKIAYEWVIISY